MSGQDLVVAFGALGAFLAFDLVWIRGLFDGAARADEEADALLARLERNGLRERERPAIAEGDGWESP